VERTPPQYFDHQNKIEAERDAAAAELRDRLLAMGQALDRDNPTEALIALSPAPDVYLIGPEEGMIVRGSDQLESTLGSLLESREVSAEVRDVEVGIAPGANVGWFHADLVLPGHTPGGEPLRMTGVYLRDAGIWKLVQAHISLPFTPPPADSASSPSASAADSVAAATAR
jgi:ketosteroid isomerase-like protein